MTFSLRQLYQDTRLRYLFVGGSSFLLDIGLLYVLHGRFNVSLALATTIAFWLAMVYNFLTARFWAFKHTQREGLEKHFTLYALLVCTNYFVTLGLVSWLSHFMYFVLAKGLVVTAQTCWNYAAYKYFVFK